MAISAKVYSNERKLLGCLLVDKALISQGLDAFICCCIVVQSYFACLLFSIMLYLLKVASLYNKQILNKL